MTRTRNLDERKDKVLATVTEIEKGISEGPVKVGPFMNMSYAAMTLTALKRLGLIQRDGGLIENISDSKWDHEAIWESVNGMAKEYKKKAAKKKAEKQALIAEIADLREQLQETQRILDEADHTHLSEYSDYVLVEELEDRGFTVKLFKMTEVVVGPKLNPGEQ